MIAALFVAERGPYTHLWGVDPWTKTRDARRYGGPHPVVAHPPCERWGRYWFGGPTAHKMGRRHIKGDDDGCFAAALAAVRTWGGVLEHPEASSAWEHFGLVLPPRNGGWVRADAYGGFTCCVEQGHYGHRARKATWLYAVDVELLDLKWGPSSAAAKLDAGFHSTEERRLFMSPPRNLTRKQRRQRRRFLLEYASRTGKVWCCPEQMSKRERLTTPYPFRDLLLAIARTHRSHTFRMLLERIYRMRSPHKRWERPGGPIARAVLSGHVVERDGRLTLTDKGYEDMSRKTIRSEGCV